MGFQEGVHYVGYSDIDDLAAKVDHYLGRPEARLAIASRAQDRVLAGHTYDACARRLLDAVDAGVVARSRARRERPPHRAADIYARYYIARGHASDAVSVLAQAPADQWLSASRARTIGRLVRAVCGRVLTGQEIH
jgi:hypothetical protein